MRPDPLAGHEDWRQVALAPFSLSPGEAIPLTAGHVKEAMATTWTCPQAQLIIVDGQAWPPGAGDWPVGLLAEIAESEAPTHLDPAVSWPWENGPRQAWTICQSPKTPLGMYCLASGGRSGGVLEIRVKAGVQAELHVCYHALGPARQHLGGRIHLEKGARLRILETQPLSRRGILTTAWQADVESGADLHWQLLSRGGDLVRQRIAVDLLGRESTFSLDAGLLAAGTDQAHLVTRINHLAGNRSQQLVKCLLDDRCRASLDAIIHMAVGADGADAHLQHRSLVRSPLARADSRPQLDIRADDVKAAHGATIGQLDVQELQYLTMRGLDPALAKQVLSRAWLGELLERFPAGALRPELMPT